MRRALALLVLLVTACEGSFIRPEDLGRKVEINKSYEARDTCLKHKAVDGMASADPAELASTAALACQSDRRCSTCACTVQDGVRLAAGV